MPLWLYHLHPAVLALLMVAIFEIGSLLALVVVRRWVMPHLKLHDGINDAISGTVQVIGVFYGITVGLIAVGVYDTYSSASELCSKEAAAIAGLYRDVSSFPEPARTGLRDKLRTYTQQVVEVAWPTQMAEGRVSARLVPIMDEFQFELTHFEPRTEGQKCLFSESLRAFNNMIEQRRLRMDAVSSGLSEIMWGVILVGAAISMLVTCFFHVEDFRLHAILIALMAGFLGIVVFMIITNDRPFVGYAAVPPSSYQLILDTLMAP